MIQFRIFFCIICFKVLSAALYAVSQPMPLMSSFQWIDFGQPI